MWHFVTDSDDADIMEASDIQYESDLNDILDGFSKTDFWRRWAILVNMPSERAILADRCELCGDRTTVRFPIETDNDRFLHLCGDCVWIYHV